VWELWDGDLIPENLISIALPYTGIRSPSHNSPQFRQTVAGTVAEW